jgi:hypothetical protein
MASQAFRDSASVLSSHEVAATMTPTGLAQYRLDRLMELRAIVDSLRLERGEELLANARREYGHACCS